MRTLNVLPLILMSLSACAPAGSPNNGTGDGTGPATSSRLAAYGTINGGGGVGVRCDGRLEMLDLYEARQAGLTLLPTPTSQKDAVELVASKFSKHFWNIDTISPVEHSSVLATDIIAPIFEGRAFKNYESEKEEAVERVDQLPLSNDFGKYNIPANCSLEQVAYFSDTNTNLKIAKNFDELDWLSKSVLVSHELAYLMDRRDGLLTLRNAKAKFTSQESRYFVGRLFTVESIPAKSDKMPAIDQIYECRDAGKIDVKDLTYAYAFESAGDGTVSFVFNAIRGRSSLYQLRADFGRAKLSALTDTAEGVADDITSLSLPGSPRASGFKVAITKAKGQSPVLTLLYKRDGSDTVTRTPISLVCEKFLRNP